MTWAALLMGVQRTIKETFSLEDVPREALYIGMAGVLPYLATSLSTVYLAWDINYAASNGTGFLLSGHTAELLLHIVEPLQVGYGAVVSWMAPRKAITAAKNLSDHLLPRCGSLGARMGEIWWSSGIQSIRHWRRSARCRMAYDPSTSRVRSNHAVLSIQLSLFHRCPSYRERLGTILVQHLSICLDICCRREYRCQLGWERTDYRQNQQTSRTSRSAQGFA